MTAPLQKRGGMSYQNTGALPAGKPPKPTDSAKSARLGSTRWMIAYCFSCKNHYKVSRRDQLCPFHHRGDRTLVLLRDM